MKDGYVKPEIEIKGVYEADVITISNPEDTLPEIPFQLPFVPYKE